MSKSLNEATEELSKAWDEFVRTMNEVYFVPVGKLVQRFIRWIWE